MVLTAAGRNRACHESAKNPAISARNARRQRQPRMLRACSGCSKAAACSLSLACLVGHLQGIEGALLTRATNSVPRSGEVLRVVLEWTETAAYQQLFRHLADPRKLRRNPLARRFLGYVPRAAGERHDAELQACQNLLALVAEAAASCQDEMQSATGKRQYAVFTRCVLQGEPWHQVARDLGLSYRQLARDKAEVSRRVAARLPSLASEWRGEAIVVDRDARAHVSAARVAADAGRFSVAEPMLLDVGRNAPNAEVRVDALNKLAALFLERYRYDLAEDALLRAEEAASVSSPDQGEINSAIIASRRAEIKWAQGQGAEASSLYSRAVNTLRRRSTADPRARVELGVALCNAAQLALHQGDTHAGYRTARDGMRLVHEPGSLADVETRVDALITYAVALSRMTTGKVEAETVMRTAVDLAEQYGLRSRATVASLFLANVTRPHNAALAEGQMLACLSVARAIGHPRLIVEAEAAVIAQQLNTAGKARDSNALDEHFDRILSIVPAGDHLWVSTHLLRARYELARGHIPAATRLAETAERAISKLGSRLQKARSLWTQAEIFRLSSERTARELIQEAVEIAEQCGNVFLLKECYAAALSITGDRRFGERARALR